MGYKKRPVKRTESVKKTRKNASGETEVYYVDEVTTSYESYYEADTSSSSSSYDSGSSYGGDSSSC
jgi:hypothetical protein